MKLTHEIIEKVRTAKSSEELIQIVKENNIEITAEESVAYFAQLNLNSSDLAEDELDNVSGGGCNNLSEDDDTYDDKNKWLIFSKL